MLLLIKKQDNKKILFTHSSAALPTTFICIEEKNKINKSISRFVLPVGATSIYKKDSFE